MRLGAIVLLVLLVQGIKLNAQKLNFQQYSIESGLARSSVYALFQDDHGYLWVGLDGGGVAQFNGYEFKTFDITQGLPSQFVRSVFQDSKGNMWFGTTEGLAMYNFEEMVSFSVKNGLSDNYIRAIAEDDEGQLWIGTDSFVNVYKDGKFTVLGMEDGLLHRHVRNITRDRNGRMWVATDNGITVFGDAAPVQYTIMNGLPNGTVLVLFEDRNGIMWAGTKYGVAAISGDGIRYYDEEDGLVSNRVRAVAQDKFGNIWFGTREGASKFDGINFHNYGANSGLSNERIRDIILDDYGNLWFATFFGGLNKYSGDDFVTYSTTNGLLADQVFGITENTQGDIVLGTFKGVSILDFKDQKLTETINFPPENGLSGEHIFSVHTTADGYSWLGTNFGITILKNDSLWTIGPGDGLNGLEVYAIHQENDSIFWIGTSNGISRITFINPNTYSVFSDFTYTDYTGGRITSDITTDKYGRLWVAFKDGGLLVTDPNSKEKLYRPATLEKIDHVLNIAPSDSCVWIGTDGMGICQVDLSQPGKLNILRHYTTEDGLSSNHIYTLLVPDSRTLWAGSEKGIDCVTMHEEGISVKHYGKHDGIDGVEIHENSGYIDHAGNYWFGTVKGVVMLDGNVSGNEHVVPDLHITDVRIFGNSVDWVKREFATEVKKRFGLPDIARLPYNENSVSFYFTGINLSHPQGIRYKWILEGFDEEWSAPSYRRSVNYTNLSPGSYTFKVLSCSENGEWNEEPAVFEFTIARPFWLTQWFITLCIGIVILLFYLLSQLRVRRLRLAKDKLEKEIEKATRDLRKEKNLVESKNSEIEKQRDALGEFNKSITDSINYAQRIQKAIMRRRAEDSSQLRQRMFVFYRPKDIVSGDFYWYTDKSGQSYVAAVDCTGHGVPGAFMSMIGITYLNQIINRSRTALQPGEILDHLRVHVIDALKNEGDEKSKDGMDVALCKIDWDSNKVFFAGANNPLYIIRNNELIEIKGDKMPVGEHDLHDTPFRTHTVDVQPGDMLYVFSDGYADQFGGENGKKFLYKRFKDLLVEISGRELEKQKELLIEQLDKWSEEHDQVDDILVIGVRL